MLFLIELRSNCDRIDSGAKITAAVVTGVSVGNQIKEKEK